MLPIAELVPAKLFVGGLSYDTTENSLAAYFSRYGPVSSSIVLRDPVTSHSRGFGFVTFSSKESAELVMSHSRTHVIDGRKVEAKFAVPRNATPGGPQQPLTVSGSGPGGPNNSPNPNMLQGQPSFSNVPNFNVNSLGNISGFPMNMNMNMNMMQNMNPYGNINNFAAALQRNFTPTNLSQIPQVNISNQQQQQQQQQQTNQNISPFSQNQPQNIPPHILQQLYFNSLQSQNPNNSSPISTPNTSLNNSSNNNTAQNFASTQNINRNINRSFSNNSGQNGPNVTSLQNVQKVNFDRNFDGKMVNPTQKPASMAYPTNSNLLNSNANNNNNNASQNSILSNKAGANRKMSVFVGNMENTNDMVSSEAEITVAHSKSGSSASQASARLSHQNSPNYLLSQNQNIHMNEKNMRRPTYPQMEHPVNSEERFGNTSTFRKYSLPQVRFQTDMSRNKIKVSNLHTNISEEKLTQFFNNFGDVLEVEITQNNTNGNLMALVTFKNFETVLGIFEVYNSSNNALFLLENRKMDLQFSSDVVNMNLNNDFELLQAKSLNTDNISSNDKYEHPLKSHSYIPTQEPEVEYEDQMSNMLNKIALTGLQGFKTILKDDKNRSLSFSAVKQNTTSQRFHPLQGEVNNNNEQNRRSSSFVTGHEKLSNLSKNHNSNMNNLQSIDEN